MLTSKFSKLVHTIGYDRIKEEYMLGKHGSLTDKQLEKVLEKASNRGRGGINFEFKKRKRGI